MVRRVSSAKKKPTTSEPASPIKILAGGKLNTKNPDNVPMKTSARPPTKTWPLIAAAVNKMQLAITAIPADAPSILSRKLNALIIKTIQTAESTEVIILLSMKNSTLTSARAAAVTATAN